MRLMSKSLLLPALIVAVLRIHGHLSLFRWPFFERPLKLEEMLRVYHTCVRRDVCLVSNGVGRGFVPVVRTAQADSGDGVPAHKPARRLCAELCAAFGSWRDGRPFGVSPLSRYRRRCVEGEAAPAAALRVLLGRGLYAVHRRRPLYIRDTKNVGCVFALALGTAHDKSISMTTT